MKETFAALLVCCDAARKKWQDEGNTEWRDRWEQRLTCLVNMLPSSNGVNNGTTLVSIAPGRVVLACGYHHRDSNGFLSSWTQHRIIVRAEFSGVSVTVTGSDHNDIHTYLGDLYQIVFSALLEWDEAGMRYVP